jgi:hypothetical protein
MHDIFFLFLRFYLACEFVLEEEEWSLEKHTVPGRCWGEIQLRFCVYV